MLKIRRPLGRLIFNMGIAIPGKTVFLIETAPWSREPNCIVIEWSHNLYQDYPITNWECQPIEGHVSDPTYSITASSLRLATGWLAVLISIIMFSLSRFTSLATYPIIHNCVCITCVSARNQTDTTNIAISSTYVDKMVMFVERSFYITLPSEHG